MGTRFILAAAAAVAMTVANGRADEGDAKAPNPAGTLVAKGIELKKDKKFQAAGEFFRAALKVHPKHPEAMYQLAWVCNELKEYDEAITLARAVLKLNAKDSDAWRELGYAQLKTGENDDAVRSFRTAIKLNGRDVEAHRYIVSAYKALGDADEAAEWQTKLDGLTGGGKTGKTKPGLPTADAEEEPQAKKPAKPVVD